MLKERPQEWGCWEHSQLRACCLILCEDGDTWAAEKGRNIDGVSGAKFTSL